ncbi:TAT-variant-translocated molybdopterin oxidoreductase [Gemmata sp. G18]|uniref:TAT-variant-translocated molybdopterin oxidoreductase n=1 Tax=Gemmata palustris TaxID=2822762 RepID=A0ABS5BZV4_9BACT|nr:TAT-variant-translocated molybdopterin oxidoreductase [Gemmata palustris]MBP3959257.1 TAT-variant-translocated molybdopterin oxidoreductase [Gemmata palustris]
MDRQSYYRSLEQLADSPEFRASASEEFPGYANVFESLGAAELRGDEPESVGLNRRRFMALSVATLGAAALAGCRRPDIQILPFSAVPDEQIGHVVPGKPTFYATSVPRTGGALPVLVESHDGRPTKIEGNPQHPSSLGSTDVHAQASVLDLYSPDRVMSDKYPGVMEGKAARKWEDFDRFARGETEKLVKDKGKGFYVLTEQVPSPALRVLRAAIKDKLPLASWHSYEAVDTSESLKGAETAFGSKLVARYRFDKAERVLALDSDFLGNEADGVFHSRGFAAKRKSEHMNRLYVVESTYTVTGTMADHRLRVPATQVGAYLLALADELKKTHAASFKKPDAVPDVLPASTGSFPGKWVKSVAKDFAEHAGKSLIVVGPRQAAWVHALAHALNDALGNYAAGMAEFRDAPAEQVDKTLKELVTDIAAGRVSTVLVIGGNPVFNAPADFRFGEELAKVAKKIRLGSFFDQTSERCDWHLPLAHFLEGWGDTEAGDGSLCCVQPLIAPLNSGKSGSDDAAPPARGGRTALEVLALLTQAPGADGKPVASFTAAQKAGYGYVRKAFSDRSGIALTAPNFDDEFNRYKQVGFFPVDADKAKALKFAKPDETNRKPKGVSANKARVAAALAPYQPAEAPTKDAVELTFHPSYALYDGSGAMNPWLQEMPDPITKLVWDNAAILSPATATAFGVAQNDIVEIRLGESTLAVPVFVLPGQADYSVALPFGQFGQMRIAHVPNGGGTDVLPLRRSTALHTAVGATLKKTGRKADLVTTQEHGVIPEGRDIVREVDAGKKKDDHQPGSDHGHEKPGGAHDHGPKLGIAPTGHITEEALKKEFQGGYGNKQQPPAPSGVKQERFPLDLARPELLDSQFQWGMVIDLSACSGCTACLIACQTENNIPVVGKDEVKRNRELHWIRIDRYFSSATTHGEAADAEPTIVSQPVACVHCEAAPCEQVCPVNATVHSPEGLNLQVYNRCIGTRYCSNACPYKVRRFNWFDFNKRRLDELRVATPFASGGMSFTESGVPETLKMQKNPDVTVRMRGVMEKCTYCVQRLERGKYGAKIAAAEVAQDRRTIETDGSFKTADGSLSAYKKPKNPLAAGYDLDAVGRVIVPDGVIVTACQAACPAQAITFGNMLDPKSKVAKLKAQESDYLLLGELNTKPRTSYLPRRWNRNPDMVSKSGE